MLRLVLSALFAVSLFAPAALSEKARVITWDDLVPAAAPFEDPFKDLSRDVKDDLSFVLRSRSDLEFGFIEVGSGHHELLLETERKLAEQGVDVEGLIAKLDELNDEAERRMQQVVPELDGAVVRLPGYALPLEFTEGGVKEFLLVPYVGACIHVPPPPPNQMVLVQLDEEFVLESLYEPVWTTGQITTKQSSQTLSYVDGQADVATGYTMNASKIEPYE